MQHASIFANFLPMRLLMVCLGNICRSPIAEGVMRKKAEAMKLDWLVESAGTNAYHTGQAPHHLSQKVCLEHGIDISGQRARTFIADDFNNYDIIYAMASDVYTEIRRIGGAQGNMRKAALFTNELTPGQNRPVPDPYYGAIDGYYAVYRLIDETCDAIIKKYALSRQDLFSRA